METLIAPSVWRWLAVLALMAGLPVPALAQTGGVTLDFGGARSLPPGGTDAVEASYGLLGLSGEQWWTGGTGVGFSLLGGQATGTSGSDFASGQLVVELWTDRGGTVDFGLGGRAYAFRVGRPFVYETTTGEIWPQVRFAASSVALTLKAEAGFGESNIAIHRRDGTVRRGTRELWHRGGVAELSALVPRGVVSGGGGYYEGFAGTYRRGFLEYLFTGPATVGLSGEVWDTPEGVRYAGGIGLQLSLGGPWSFRADGGRGAPNPLIRAPQGIQGGGFIGLRLFETDSRGEAGSLIDVGPKTPEGVRVRFTLPGDLGGAVSLLGDFNDWEAQRLTRDGGDWVIELALAPGTYHFGFEVDGEWYLPPEAPGRVADDWGQQNATLIVPMNDVTEEGR